jgi:predicted peroxiredoxin
MEGSKYSSIANASGVNLPICGCGLHSPKLKEKILENVEIMGVSYTNLV